MLYATVLVSSLWISFELRYDFQMAAVGHGAFWSCLPWVVASQLAVLFWRRQCRGLVSYFSFLELVQIGYALGIACLFHLVLRQFAPAGLAPSPGVIGTDFVLSCWGITYARLSLRFMREGQKDKANGVNEKVNRVAIIGAGELGTKVALDILNAGPSTQVVAFFDDDPHSWNQRPYDIPVVGMPECLLNSEWRDKVDEVIVALPEQGTDRPREIGAMARTVRLKVTFASGWPVLEPVH